MKNYVKKILGKDKDGSTALLQQLDRVLTREEREFVVRESIDNPRFNSRVAVEVIGRLYMIKNPRIKTDKLRMIEDILKARKDPGTCRGLSEKLKDIVDQVTKRTIYNLLGELATNDDVPALVSLLRLEDSESRRIAYSILLELDHAAIATELSSALERPPWSNKSEALNLLFDTGRIESINICKKLMEEGVEGDRRHAIGILQRLDSDEAINVIDHALENEKSPRLRLQIALSLQLMENPNKLRPLIKLLSDKRPDIVLAALDGIDQLGDVRALKVIRAMVEHFDLAVQIRCIEVLGKMGREEDVDILIPILKHENIRVRQTGMDALYRIAFAAESNISRILLNLMSDRDVNVRRCVADILNRIKDEALFDTMFSFLQDEDWWVREAIAETLISIKDARVVPAAIKLLGNADEGLRRYGVEILMGVRDSRAVQPIINLLNDPDWWVRERAVEALGYLGDTKVVPLLVNMLNVKELVYVAAQALGELGDSRVVPYLVKRLKDSRPDVRIKILESLAKLDAGACVGEIKPMLTDSDKDVRNKAREVLRSMEAELGESIEESDRWWKHQNLGQLDAMLLEVRVQGGTDMLLVTGSPPLMRVEGMLQPLHSDSLKQEAIWQMVQPILSKEQEDTFIAENDLDFSYEIPGEGRFRGNCFVQNYGMNAVFRLIPDKLPSMDQLRLPRVIKNLSKLSQGLILFAGPASCGKTTTMACLVDMITRSRYEHIITIEDPIEYLYDTTQMSVVTQREVGRHSKSFPTALRAALREDPDVIVVGEMRDFETISIAISAAETGHLVLATVHSISAPKTIDRMIDVFPTSQQDQIRLMLGDSLRAVISQQLLTRRDGRGRVAAFEVLMITPAISNLIREGKVFQIAGNMTTGRQHGMQTMERALAELVQDGYISSEEALAKAYNQEDFVDNVDLA
ncbi:PilT/PilU family type 4a pilus ATPase [bacterium]|nr:PilT/PilU family type 4a pilus ATPase [candidate division CSSED10-310 bacterium]